MMHGTTVLWHCVPIRYGKYSETPGKWHIPAFEKGLGQKVKGKTLNQTGAASANCKNVREFDTSRPQTRRVFYATWLCTRAVSMVVSV